MALHPDFPVSPYAIPKPDQRWFSASEDLRKTAYENLLPPLVAKIREEVSRHRLRRCIADIKALLRWWFLSGQGLDDKLVHMEQSNVQAMLDALPADERSAILESINSAFNSSLRAVSNFGGASDARYNRVLSDVEGSLGRPIDFGSQTDREAIGNALIKDLRRSGACTRTGSRIPTC